MTTTNELWKKRNKQYPADMTFENSEVSFCVLKGPLRWLSVAKHVERRSQ